jgi:NADPH2:quinone reductase
MMKAVFMTAVGGPEVLQLQETREPTPGSKDLLVRLKAAGVNPLDWKMRKKGTRYPDRLPAILGCDGAGIVEEIGQDVDHFKKGDEVYFCHGGIGDHPGNYAELAIVNEDYVARKPTSLNFLDAGAAPLVLITAWESLHDRAKIKKGQKILVHAGAGGVGHVAIQLAKAAGCQVCTTVGSEEKANFVYSVGADKAILYKKDDFVQAVLDWTDGNGVDVALDTVGDETFAKSLSAVRYYGDLVTILSPPVDMNWGVARVRNVRVSFELMLTPMTEELETGKQHHAWILEQCGSLFDDGRLKIKVDRTFPLHEAAEAHNYLESGSGMGKVVLAID